MRTRTDLAKAEARLEALGPMASALFSLPRLSSYPTVLAASYGLLGAVTLCSPEALLAVGASYL